MRITLSTSGALDDASREESRVPEMVTIQTVYMRIVWFVTLVGSVLSVIVLPGVILDHDWSASPLNMYLVLFYAFILSYPFAHYIGSVRKGWNYLAAIYHFIVGAFFIGATFRMDAIQTVEDVCKAIVLPAIGISMLLLSYSFFRMSAGAYRQFWREYMWRPGK